jgi:hypothetical protein
LAACQCRRLPILLGNLVAARESAGHFQSTRHGVIAESW